MSRRRWGSPKGPVFGSRWLDSNGCGASARRLEPIWESAQQIFKCFIRSRVMSLDHAFKALVGA